MKKSPKTKIILASGSPRRKLLLGVLLKNFGLNFQVKPSNIAEYIPRNIANFGRFAQDLAELKALASAEKNDGVIIAADTIVVYNNKVFGKPANKAEAVKMLKMLSGKEHKVYTGLCIINTLTNKVYKTYQMTRVKFRKLDEDEIRFYVKSGSPMDKAGAYGIQDDFGSTFVEKITGDYFNVVGLPVVKTYLGLKKILNYK